MSEEETPKKLTTEEALALLAEGDSVHTFRQAGPALIGADHPRETLVDSIREYGCQLSGATATAMGHGMVLEDDHGYLFIATKPEATP